MIYIERIIRKMNQGQTGPYLCVGSDNEQYIVKGPNTTYSGLIHELVCGHLGRILGLPIPTFTTAYVSSALLKYGSYDLDEGEWFASKYEENIQDVTFQKLSELSDEKLKLLFLFDYWIQNGDRNLTASGGNPNLFIRADLESFVVLDHNLAFDPEYDETFEQNKNLHVGARAWFSQQLSLFDSEDYRTKLTNCFNELDSIMKYIPDEWIENSLNSNITEDIKETLMRYKAPKFWEDIK